MPYFANILAGLMSLVSLPAWHLLLHLNSHVEKQSSWRHIRKIKASFLALMNGHTTARPCLLGKLGKMEIILQTNKEKCKATVEPTVTTKC